MVTNLGALIFPRTNDVRILPGFSQKISNSFARGHPRDVVLSPVPISTPSLHGVRRRLRETAMEVVAKIYNKTLACWVQLFCRDFVAGIACCANNGQQEIFNWLFF